MAQILLAGDSTVTEQPRAEPYDAALCYCGWGQMLGRVLRPGAVVKNFAKSGLTVESFRREGHHKSLMQCLRPEDFVLFQFGHNDQKLASLKAEQGYARALEAYALEVRAGGATPVFVTPAARNSYRGDTGEYNDLLAPYAAAMAEVARGLNVALLDLHALSLAWLQGLGLQGAKRYFYPGDYTHPNHFGGYCWARFVAGEILAAKQEDLGPLKAMVLPAEQWEAFDAPAARADPVYGWLHPPLRRSSFSEYRRLGLLSKLEAAEMATVGYGYFATTATEENSPLPLRAALENGYLPWGEGLEPDEYSNLVCARAFREIMLLAAGGRNALPPAARQLALKANEDGTVNRLAAVDYALRLEALATGSVARRQSGGYSPKGS